MNAGNDVTQQLESERKEKLIRWQAIRISQLSNTNNLIIGLSTGLLGFCASQSQNISEPCIVLLIYWLSLLTLLISLFCGVCCNLNRLDDFRKTTQIHNKETTDFDKELLRAETKRLGKLTWILLNYQLYSFFIGVLLSTIWFVIHKSN